MRKEREYLRRHRLYTLSLALIWVGGIEIIASFLAKFLFQYEVQFTPYFFLTLLVGIVLYVVARMA
jgi:hypothetical protein